MVLPAALAALTVGTAFAAPPTPAPDPAPVSTTTTTRVTTRVTTTPRPAVSPTTTTHTTTHTTTRTKTAKKTVRPVQKPIVKVKPKVTHKPKPIPPKPVPPKPNVTTKPAIGTNSTVPRTSAVGGASDTTRSGSNRGRLLLMVGALGLLALSLVPTRIVVSLGRLEPARAATVRVSLAVAGLSVGIGYLLALMLNKTS